MRPFDFRLPTRVVFGPDTVNRLGELVRELGGARTLVVADPGLVAAGHVDRALMLLTEAGITPFRFHDFDANPDSRMVQTGRAHAAACGIESIVAIGGGSALDCAKGINFVLTNGGTMRDYRGYGRAARPMLPMMAVPTTAGTGSDAQSYALISDADTHAKMACGDSKAAFRVAVLDPVLTVSQPRAVTAAAGYDAISHAVEAYVTATRTGVSDLFARDAWRLLESHYERVLAEPVDLVARGAMLLGAHEAGVAIEQSMLGATHACANPLTARHGTTHGVAISVMLPHVVRWNAGHVGDRYRDLLRVCGRAPGAAPGERLAERLDELARAGGLPRALRELGVPREELVELAADAATQWTGTFNPRPFDADAALALYESAY
ncbi:MAG: iron-containing alcohol dehydrogenase [Acidobacteria bacterium]|nr:iron-containing alcohol dehydrogenase [Acidobacteriota bacterium]